MLTTAQAVRKNSFIRHNEKIHKVLEHDYQMGGGKAGGLVHIKIRDIETGHVTEVKFDPHEKIDELEIERHKMKYLYEDKSGLCFMDPLTYDQITLGRATLGHLATYLKEDMEVEVEFYDGNPIHVTPPAKITLQVISTGAVKKGEPDSVYKSATLEGGIEMLVPPFIKNGDKVCVDVETGKYLDRVKE